MAKVSAESRTVQVELPAEAFQQPHLETSRGGQETRLLWLLEEARSRRLGSGKRRSFPEPSLPVPPADGETSDLSFRL
jgi:hypothetical protein